MAAADGDNVGFSTPRRRRAGALAAPPAGEAVGAVVLPAAEDAVGAVAPPAAGEAVGAVALAAAGEAGPSTPTGKFRYKDVGTPGSRRGTPKAMVGAWGALHGCGNAF